MEFLRDFGWMAGLGLTLAMQAGCANDLPPVEDEGTSTGDGGSSSSDVPPGTGTGSPDTTTGALDTTAGETSDTDGEPGCGNGIVEAGEQCDAADLAGETCEGLGFGAGTLACDEACELQTSSCAPGVPVLSLGFSQIKQLDLSWAAVQGAEHYQVLESPAPGEPLGPIGSDIVGRSVSFEMPLHLRLGASYVLRACNAAGCTDSAAVDVVDSMVDAVGYVKASNTGTGDEFGMRVALSADGNTLAVGARGEDSIATGIGGNEADASASFAGAVYVFVRDPAGGWSQQAYVKASNTGDGDQFGSSVALSGDGDTLVVGAIGEGSTATGIGGNEDDDGFDYSGAVYVFVRDGAGAWSQQAYVKASNTGVNDFFGQNVALSEDGDTLAVGAASEDSSATGIGGNAADNSAASSGAVYVFVRSGVGVWSQQAYVKASNTDADDQFGWSVALSGDGSTLAVGASGEASNATGIGGNQADDSAFPAGAVYVFVRSGVGVWSQQAYVKASNTGASDLFGWSVSLSGDGSMLAVGARGEASSATGIGGDESNNGAVDSGAVYVFVRNGAEVWSQQAYVKASNADAGDLFGIGVALSQDGSTLAVGAIEEASDATGIGGDQADDGTTDAGAVYVFVHDGAGAWSQRAYVKASNTGVGDQFGVSLALSADGNTLAVGASGEASSATDIGGDQASDAAVDAGAVYLY